MASRIVQYRARQAFQRMIHVAAVPTTRNRIAPLASTCFTHVRVFSDTKGTEEAPKEDPDTTQEAAHPDVEEEPREIQLEKQVIELKDQLLRSLAEQENTRRIAKRDVESARNFAIKSFAKSLLDTSDNLALALDAVPEELRSDKEGNAVLANLYEGIQMTQMGLDKAFEQNGLKRYGEVGDVFDPNHHEALFQYPDPNLEAGTIGQVMKKGFFLNKRVLRPAEVGVIKN